MQAGKSQRSVLALVITCALILGFGIPLIPLVGVDSAEGTEVSAASDVATVSAENSLQNGSFEQPDVYQYRETSDVPYWKSTTTSGNIEIGSVFKNGNGDNDSLHMRTGEKVAAAEGSQFGKPATSNSRSSPRTRMAPNRHRSHGVAAPTCSTTCSSGCSATVGTAPAGPSPTAAKARSSSAPPPWATAVNGYQSHWYRAGNDCSDTEHFPITWTITFVSSVFNQYTRNGWNEYEGEFAADGDDTVFALAPTTRSTATSHTAISWTTCPLPRKAATAATS